jgi:hypothetical protein
MVAPLVAMFAGSMQAAQLVSAAAGAQAMHVVWVAVELSQSVMNEVTSAMLQAFCAVTGAYVGTPVTVAGGVQPLLDPPLLEPLLVLLPPLDVELVLLVLPPELLVLLVLLVVPPELLVLLPLLEVLELCPPLLELLPPSSPLKPPVAVLEQPRLYAAAGNATQHRMVVTRIMFTASSGVRRRVHADARLGHALPAASEHRQCDEGGFSRGFSAAAKR